MEDNKAIVILKQGKANAESAIRATEEGISFHQGAIDQLLIKKRKYITEVDEIHKAIEYIRDSRSPLLHSDV